MPLHPQAEALLAMLASLGDPPMEQCTPDRARAIRKSRWRPSSVEVHEIVHVDAGGVPARLYRPSAVDGLGLLVYFHGGGWVIGDLDSHDDVCRRLAVGSGHCVLNVAYRLAPENPFPAAHDDALAAACWAHDNAAALGCREDRIAIGGDSAGGNLTAVVAQTEPSLAVLQALVYPALDATMGFPSIDANAEGMFLTKPGMRWFYDHYAKGVRGDDPRLSPLYAADEALAAGPPAVVLTAEYDPLRDEGDAYAARLASLGVPTSHLRYGGMFHGFFSLGDFLDDGRTAVAAIAAAVAARFERLDAGHA